MLFGVSDMKIMNLLFLLIAVGLISGCVFPDNYHHPSSYPQGSSSYPQRSYSTTQPPVPAQQQSTSSLPYGLQKKLQRGQSLPPGWQKKLRVGSVLDPRIYSRGDIVVPLDRHGLMTIRVEGKLIRLYQATREITEILN